MWTNLAPELVLSVSWTHDCFSCRLTHIQPYPPLTTASEHFLRIEAESQAVCRTKFRGAAIFGTTISLRPHEVSPLLRVSRSDLPVKIQIAWSGYFLLRSRSCSFPTQVLCFFPSAAWDRSWPGLTEHRRRTASCAQRWAAHRLYQTAPLVYGLQLLERNFSLYLNEATL